MTSISYFTIIESSVLAALLILIYAACLIHVRLGSKYSFVTKLICLLLLYNIFLLIANFADIKVFLKHEATTSSIWLLCISYGLWNCLFNVAHFMLAWKYYRMSKEMPEIMTKQINAEEFIPV